jgi:hypothetical protein
MSEPIIGAYHVAVFPGWEGIVVAQCARLRNSGLLARTAEVLVGIVGEIEPARSTIERLLDGKARVVPGGPLSGYEFGTLHLLHSAASERDFRGWYIHTKGVSTLGEAAANHRKLMESVVLDHHQECCELLEDHDAVGPSWRSAPEPHFSGNFWWARASYLRTLPCPLHLHVADRYQAEFWIGKNANIRMFELAFPPNPFDRPSAWVGLETKYQTLCEIQDPKVIRRIVDIGVDYGFSTFHLARDFPHAEVVGVSDFQLHLDSESWVRSHLHLFPNLKILQGDSAQVGLTFGHPVDLIHIDGDHSYEGVKADFEGWTPWLRPGGCVLFHDTEAFPGVRQFFDELSGRKKEIKEHFGLGCWFKEA